MAETRGTFQGNLQGTPSRPLEMLTSSKALTASYALEAEKLSTAEVGGVSQSIYVSGGKPVALSSTIGSKTKPVYISGGKFTPADDIPTSKTGSWDTATNWLATNSGSISEITSSVVRLESSASAIKTEIADTYLPLTGGTITGDLVVNQNLTVKGTTVSIDAQNLNVKDKLILVASGSTTQAAADGAGMAVATASAGEGGAARIQYESAGNRFTSSVNFAAPGFTGSLKGNVVGNVTGTASFATSASYAVDATNAISASEATHAVTASWALDSKHANTASIALLANSATSASYATSASNATNATSASRAESAASADNATSASYNAAGASALAWIIEKSASLVTEDDLATAISASLPQPLWASGSGRDSVEQKGMYSVDAIGEGSLATGYLTKASGNYSHAEGNNTRATGSYSHAEGFYAVTLGSYSHAEGYGGFAEGTGSHVEGRQTTSSGQYSHAEGSGSIASGYVAHAEGGTTYATGSGSHAEGNLARAIGNYSHAEGYATHASGTYSHAEGYSTRATNQCEHAQGKANSTASGQIFSIGVGHNLANAKNAISVITGSGAVPSASVYVFGIGGYNGKNPTAGTNDLATVVNSASSAITPASASMAWITRNSSSATLWTASTGYRSLVPKDHIAIGLGTGSVAFGAYREYGRGANVAEGQNSFAHGEGCRASGLFSHAEGWTTTASGDWGSHAEGRSTKAIGEGSHAEGSGSKAYRAYSHAEGSATIVGEPGDETNAMYMEGGHAEGSGSKVLAHFAHAEGKSTIASGSYSHAEGCETITTNDNEHAEGQYNVTASGQIFSIGVGPWDSSRCNAISVIRTPTGYSGFPSASVFVYGIGGYDGTNPVTGSNDLATVISQISASAGGDEIWVRGTGTGSAILGPLHPSGAIATGRYAVINGSYESETEYGITSYYPIVASGNWSHAEGFKTKAQGNYSHAEGESAIASSSYSHAEGYWTTTSGSYSHAEGYYTRTTGSYSHAEGSNTQAVGARSHAEGVGTVASGESSHAEGSNTQTSGTYAHAEGMYTLASGMGAHAEGTASIALGRTSHAEGWGTVARASGSHAEGTGSVASSSYSHAEGYFTVAKGNTSHAEGLCTIALGAYSHAEGKYNATASGQLFSIGAGDAEARRKNAVTIITGSNPSASIFVYGIGGYDGTNPTPGTNDLASVINNILQRLDSM